MSRLKVASTTWAYLPIILSTERTNKENVSVGCVNAACACIYWFFFTNPKAYPLPMDSKSPSHHIQIWWQWFLQSGSPTGTRLTRHPMFLERYLLDATPPHTYCIPSGLGVWRVCSEGIRIVCQCWLSIHIYHWDIQWQDLHFFIWLRDAPKRSAGNHNIYFIA